MPTDTLSALIDQFIGHVQAYLTWDKQLQTCRKDMRPDGPNPDNIQHCWTKKRQAESKIKRCGRALARALEAAGQDSSGVRSVMRRANRSDAESEAHEHWPAVKVALQRLQAQHQAEPRGDDDLASLPALPLYLEALEKTIFHANGNSLPDGLTPERLRDHISRLERLAVAEAARVPGVGLADARRILTDARNAVRTYAALHPNYNARPGYRGEPLETQHRQVCERVAASMDILRDLVAVAAWHNTNRPAPAPSDPAPVVVQAEATPAEGVLNPETLSAGRQRINGHKLW